MGRAERKNDSERAKREIAEKKEDLKVKIEKGEALSRLIVTPDYAVLREAQLEFGQMLFKMLTQVIYGKTKEGEPLYLTDREIAMRQRVFNGHQEWADIANKKIEEGKKAMIELQEILDDETAALESPEEKREEKTLHEFNKS